MKIKLLLITLLISFGIKSQHTISSFSPTVAGKGETVTIIGTNFTGISGASSIKFGGTNAASYVVVNSTTIRAVVPSGSSGNISVIKSSVTVTKPGFIYREGITELYGDFGGFWKTTVATAGITTKPTSTNNMLAFKYGSVIYSTGVNDPVLITQGVSFTPGNFKGLPVTLNGSTCSETGTPYQYACNRNPGVTTGVGNPTLISTGSNLDGTTIGPALFSHVNVKNLTIRSVLTDGTNGLDISTGYTNLVIGSVSTYDVKFIDSLGVVDNIPDIIVTQTADLTGKTIDSYEFLDASGVRIGRAMNTLDLNTLELLGNYNCDLYTVPPSTSFSTAKPNGVSASNASRPIRLVAFKLSDFGINSTNYNNVDKLKITASGKSDASFIAYNANTIYSLPLVEINSSTDSIFCTGETNLNLKMDVTLPGESMSYQWELKIGSGTWGNITGANSTTYIETNPSYGYQYRLKVTVNSSGYYVYSPIITLSGCLPVILNDFKALCKDIEWETSSEKDSDYFKISGSNDGIEWDHLDKIKSIGNSTELITYKYKSKEYYQYFLLNQYDIDGKNEEFGPFPNVCDIGEGDNKNTCSSYPNPATCMINFKCDDIILEINIYSIDGKKINEKYTFDQNVSFDLSMMNKSIYFYSIEMDNGNIIKGKFIKK